MRARTTSLPLILAALILGLTIAPAPASAQWFADIYLGLAVTAKSDMDFAPTVPKSFIPQSFKDVDYLNSVVWGGRGGYWFGGKDALGASEMLGDFASYVGAALDISYFRPSIPSQVLTTDVGIRRLGFMDLSVVTITPELLIRYPVLKSTEYPQGRLQPYFGLGPTIFISTLIDSTGNFGPRGRSSTDAGLGIMLGPGVAFQLSDDFFVFSEYRFARATPTFRFNGGDTDVRINSHQVIIGVSYRF